jgi:hypothetical protein
MTLWFRDFSEWLTNFPTREKRHSEKSHWHHLRVYLWFYRKRNSMPTTDLLYLLMS